MLLLGCCGNNSCDCDKKRRESARGTCECRERNERNCDSGCGCREERREERRDCDNDCGCREGRRRDNNDCNCAREAARDAVRDAKEAVRDAREAVRDAREQCDASGMVPPPWQDYPPMPRRDNGRREDRRSDCDCN